MAQPLDLGGLGVPGSRNTALVTKTKEIVLPFTQGRSDLEVGESGALAPVAKPDGKNQTRGGADEPDVHLRSRIGRRFRSF